MKILRIVLLVALVAALAGTAARADEPGYIVLTPNLESWYRAEPAKNLDLRLRAVNLGAFNGWVVHTRELILDGDVLERTIMLFSRTAEGDILYHGDPTQVFDRPVTWVDAPLEVGKTWTDSRPLPAKGGVPAGDIHYVFAVLEEQDITCPMGTYPCHRVFVATINPDGTNEGCTFWYNSTCGLIRCCLDGEATLSLQKAQILDRPDVPDLERDAQAGDPDVLGLRGVPNPFNPAAEIRFTLARELPVTVEVYDVAGRLVRRLVQAEVRSAGPQVVPWDGRDEAGRNASSGAYIARVAADGREHGVRITLVR